MIRAGFMYIFAGSTWDQTSSTIMVMLKKKHEHFWDRLAEFPRKFGARMRVWLRIEGEG